MLVRELLEMNRQHVLPLLCTERWDTQHNLRTRLHAFALSVKDDRNCLAGMMYKHSIRQNILACMMFKKWLLDI